MDQIQITQQTELSIVQQNKYSFIQTALSQYSNQYDQQFMDLLSFNYVNKDSWIHCSIANQYLNYSDIYELKRTIENKQLMNKQNYLDRGSTVRKLSFDLSYKCFEILLVQREKNKIADKYKSYLLNVKDLLFQILEQYEIKQKQIADQKILQLEQEKKQLEDEKKQQDQKLLDMEQKFEEAKKQDFSFYQFQIKDTGKIYYQGQSNSFESKRKHDYIKEFKSIIKNYNPISIMNASLFIQNIDFQITEIKNISATQDEMNNLEANIIKICNPVCNTQHIPEYKHACKKCKKGYKSTDCYLEHIIKCQDDKLFCHNSIDFNSLPQQTQQQFTDMFEIKIPQNKLM